MERFRTAYGSSPLHLLAAIASFAIAGYGFLRIVEGPSALGTLVYFGLAVVAHDLIAFPLYSGLNLLAGGAFGSSGRLAGGRAPALNYLRVPFVLSAIAFLLFFPLILGLDESRYEGATGESVDVYLGRWLLLSGLLFAGSAVLYALRLRRARRNRHSPHNPPALCRPEGDKVQGGCGEGEGEG